MARSFDRLRAVLESVPKKWDAPELRVGPIEKRGGGSPQKQDWDKEVESLMQSRYGLEPNDYMDSADKSMSPEEFVDWYGDKYDLDRIDSY